MDTSKVETVQTKSRLSGILCPVASNFKCNADILVRRQTTAPVRHDVR